MTPLCIAAYKGRPEVVRVLLAAGADKSLGDEDGPPIEQACADPDANQDDKGTIVAMLSA